MSTISDRLVELVIDASSLDQLKSALSGPSCPLRLLTDLDVSSPILANISAEDAKAAFHKRLAIDIARLKQSARPLLLRVAKLLATYKEDISRARPTPRSDIINRDLRSASSSSFNEFYLTLNFYMIRLIFVNEI